MAHIENILRDKLFVFSGSTQTTETETQILSLIVEKESLGEMFRAYLIDNEENYDSYKVKTSTGEYLVKFSLDKSYEGFKKEFDVLNSISHLKLSPRAVSVGELMYGDKIIYLITSFEEAQSANELGKSILFANHEECAKLIYSFHFEKYIAQSLKERVGQIFNATNFENQPEFASLIKEASDNYSLLADEITNLKQYIQDSYQEKFNGETLCHGNLSPSTVLFGPRKISFINWQNCFAACPLIDLSNLRMEFDFNEEFEYKLFQHYCSLGKPYTWDEYLAARNFWAAIKLLEYVFSYIKEIFLFRSMRQDKILKIFSSFCRNIRFFEHIPSFRKNKQELLNLFSVPML